MLIRCFKVQVFWKSQIKSCSKLYQTNVLWDQVFLSNLHSLSMLHCFPKCGLAKEGLVAEHCCSVFLLLYMLKVSVLRWMQFRTREIRSSNEPLYCAWFDCTIAKLIYLVLSKLIFETESISISTLSLASYLFRLAMLLGLLGFDHLT